MKTTNVIALADLIVCLDSFDQQSVASPAIFKPGSEILAELDEIADELLVALPQSNLPFLRI